MIASNIYENDRNVKLSLDTILISMIIECFGTIIFNVFGCEKEFRLSICMKTFPTIYGSEVITRFKMETGNLKKRLVFF